MGVYDPLRRFMCLQHSQELVMTFKEIEKILGRPLPTTARRPQWWASQTKARSRYVQIEAWQKAGYRAFLIAPNRVKFERSTPLFD
jgi:hypothetical protein